MQRFGQIAAVVTGLCCMLLVTNAAALTPLPEPEPQPGSYGIEATKNQPAPTVAARITTPVSGASFNESPITVRGICPDGLLVQILNNDVMVGAATCDGGSFSLEVMLFAGENELTARVYDNLGQEGPVSNTVRVRLADGTFLTVGEFITLTSSFGRRSAATGSPLSWPLQLSGGTGPYAFSIDWGDGSEAQLQSQSLAGIVNIRHTYEQAGIYTLNVRVTDANDTSAFLQLVAVSNGEVDEAAATDESGEQTPTREVIWVPSLITLALLFPAFWFGRRSQLVSLRNRMLKERETAPKP